MNITASTFYISSSDGFRIGTWAQAVRTRLVAAGWTDAGSSDGTTGGMDGVFRPSNLQGPSSTNKWFVLQSPHASAADRIQLLFSGGMTSGTTNFGSVHYNPNADYADNGLAQPTSSYAVIVSDNQLMSSSTNIQFHMLVDSDPPYGWAVQGHASLNTASRQGGWALIPLSAQGINSPGKPYVVFGAISGNSFTTTTLGSVNTSTTQSRCVCEPPNPPAVPLVSPALVMRANGVVIMPSGASLNTQNQDVSTPIIFQDANNFYGVTDFVRWMGTPRNFLDTFREGANPRARICFGQASLPWDGTTVPTI